MFSWDFGIGPICRISSGRSVVVPKANRQPLAPAPSFEDAAATVLQKWQRGRLARKRFAAEKRAQTARKQRDEFAKRVEWAEDRRSKQGAQGVETGEKNTSMCGCPCRFPSKAVFFLSCVFSLGCLFVGSCVFVFASLSLRVCLVEALRMHFLGFLVELVQVSHIISFVHKNSQ